MSSGGNVEEGVEDGGDDGEDYEGEDGGEDGGDYEGLYRTEAAHILPRALSNFGEKSIEVWDLLFILLALAT